MPDDLTPEEALTRLHDNGLKAEISRPGPKLHIHGGASTFQHGEIRGYEKAFVILEDTGRFPALGSKYFAAVAGERGHHEDIEMYFATLTQAVEFVLDIYRAPILGRTPARTELTVLPADDPPQKKIGFVCYELQGCEISKTLGGAPVPGSETLAEGSTIYAPGMFGGWHELTIRYGADGKPHGDGGTMAVLSRTKEDDPRGDVWVCIGLVNKQAIKKLEISR